MIVSSVLVVIVYWTCFVLSPTLSARRETFVSVGKGRERSGGGRARPHVRRTERPYAVGLVLFITKLIKERLCYVHNPS